jgi:hypothetical protein
LVPTNIPLSISTLHPFFVMKQKGAPGRSGSDRGVFNDGFAASYFFICFTDFVDGIAFDK